MTLLPRRPRRPAMIRILRIPWTVALTLTGPGNRPRPPPLPVTTSNPPIDSDSMSSGETVFPAKPYDVSKAYIIKEKLVHAEETIPMEVASGFVQQERHGHGTPGN